MSVLRRIGLVAAVLAIAGCSTNQATATPGQVGTFSTTGSMASTFVGRPTATLLDDGRVLIAGDPGIGGAGQSAELYDPKAGTFSLTGPWVEGDHDQTATRLTDGRVLIAGGCADATACARSARL